MPVLGAPTGPLNRPLVTAVTDHATDRATGWRPATAGCSPTATPASSARPGTSASTSRSSAWPRPPTTAGYWLVASDGGIFSLRRRRASTARPGTSSSTSRSWAWPPRPTAAATGWWPATAGCSPSATPASTARPANLDPAPADRRAWPRPADGTGYWMVAADGGVFAFGDAGFYGSAAGTAGEPVERIVPHRRRPGYWIVPQNGTAQAFGDAVGQDPAAPGPAVPAGHPGRQGRALRLPAAGQALHLGRERPGRLRLLRTGPGLVGPRRRHLLRPGGRRPVPHGRARRSPSTSCRPATSCSGGPTRPTGRPCTTRPSTWAATGSSSRPATTSSSTPSTSGALGELMPNGRRP